MSTIRMMTLTALMTAALAGCNIPAGHNATLDQARDDYRLAQVNPAIARLAPQELRQAGDALDLANEAWSKSADADEVNHLAYMARQRVAIARELASQRASDAELDQSRASRDQMRLRARTDEADTAQRSAVASQQQADVSNQQAVAARQLTEEARARNRMLESKLQEVNAQQTARGMVITIGDVLFDSDEANLKPGGVRTVEKLAAILDQYPRRRALVEGFTDSLGSQSHNNMLSGMRASAVKLVLVQAGVDGSRVNTHAYGEAYPVASNGHEQGRSLNRRVEIVLSDDSGIISPR